MALSPQHREPPALPRIRVPTTEHSQLFAAHDIPFSRSTAMSIPGIQATEHVPPPLPPPRNFLAGGPWSDEREPYTASSPSFRSGYGSMDPPSFDRLDHIKRRDMSTTHHVDEGYASYASTERSRDSFHTGFSLFHNKYQIQSPADGYSDNMKKLLNLGRPSEMSPTDSRLSSSANDFLPSRRPLQVIPSSSPLSALSHRSLPHRPFGDSPQYSAASPRSAPFSRSALEPSLTRDRPDFARSPRGHSRRKYSDDKSTTGSYDHNSEDVDMEETSSLRRLQIDDALLAGQKRKAGDSPADDARPPMISRQSDSRRAAGLLRVSPGPRLTVSIAGNAGSPGPTRSNSYLSNISALSITGSAPSVSAQLSPGHSADGVSPKSCHSPYTSVGADASPKSAAPTPTHSRTTSINGPRKVNEIQNPVGSKFQEFFMCDCCPKKPRKFDTAEELSAHEAEKQYNCSFCGNRFKNKNEAERHQNSLHVRRHSWSCSALSGFDRAFHESTNRPGEADVCGYCGDEFSRSGPDPTNSALSSEPVPRMATNDDWEHRIRHLQEVHKFRECNSSKKFFRADHFRQHLKHSHAGTSGKWTNMLENACMLEADASPR